LGILLILLLTAILVFAILLILFAPFGSDETDFIYEDEWDAVILVRSNDGDFPGHFYFDASVSQVRLDYKINDNRLTSYIINGLQSYYVQVINNQCSSTQKKIKSLDLFQPEFNGYDKNNEGEECLLFSFNIDSGILYLCMSNGYILFGRYEDPSNDTFTKIVDFSDYDSAEEFPDFTPPANCVRLNDSSSNQPQFNLAFQWESKLAITPTTAPDSEVFTEPFLGHFWFDKNNSRYRFEMDMMNQVQVNYIINSDLGITYSVTDQGCLSTVQNGIIFPDLDWEYQSSNIINNQSCNYFNTSDIENEISITMCLTSKGKIVHANFHKDSAQDLSIDFTNFKIGEPKFSNFEVPVGCNDTSQINQHRFKQVN